MMMKLIGLMAVYLILACNNTSNPKEKGVLNNGPYFNIKDIDPRVLGADSLVLVYYKDPYGTDSLRYTRYYTQYPVTDPAGLATLQQQLQVKLERKEFRNKCRGEGKIWCFSKGNIVQTLYFSTNCAKDCCYLYVIKDGMFYYNTPGKATIDWLNKCKTFAKEVE